MAYEKEDFLRWLEAQPPTRLFKCFSAVQCPLAEWLMDETGAAEVHVTHSEVVFMGPLHRIDVPPWMGTTPAWMRETMKAVDGSGVDGSWVITAAQVRALL